MRWRLDLSQHQILLGGDLDTSLEAVVEVTLAASTSMDLRLEHQLHTGIYRCGPSRHGAM